MGLAKVNIGQVWGLPVVGRKAVVGAVTLRNKSLSLPKLL